jgi:hypothetical protein
MELASGNSPNVNPTNGTISGRGLANRKSYDQRVSMAADYKSGQLTVDPSCKQVCLLFGISPADLRKELKRRAGANRNASLSDEAAYFVAVWDSLSSADREAALREMGAADVWDVLSKVIA